VIGLVPELACRVSDCCFTSPSHPIQPKDGLFPRSSPLLQSIKDDGACFWCAWTTRSVDSHVVLGVMRSIQFSDVLVCRLSTVGYPLAFWVLTYPTDLVGPLSDTWTVVKRVVIALNDVSVT
jgi:hypothetical protein